MGLDPTTLQALQFGGTVGSGVLESRAAKQEATAIRDAANFNAQVALEDAARDAARVRTIGRADRIDFETDVRGKGQLRLEGSPLIFAMKIEADAETQAQDIERVGARRAALDRSRAKNAEEQGTSLARTALLSTALKLPNILSPRPRK